MIDTPPLAPLVAALAGPEEAWIRGELAKPPATLRTALPVLLPGLARRLGRTGLTGAYVAGPVRADLSVWRRCDAGGTLLLGAADPVPDEALIDLFLRGDLEERTILLRADDAAPARARDVEAPRRGPAHERARPLRGRLPRLEPARSAPSTRGSSPATGSTGSS